MKYSPTYSTASDSTGSHSTSGYTESHPPFTAAGPGAPSSPGRFWRKVAHTAGRVPFIPEAVAGYYAMRDPATPWKHKAILAGAIAYFILPLDAVPDFILPMGYTDDAAAIAAALAATSMSITPAHRAAAARVLGQAVPGQTVPGECL